MNWKSSLTLLAAIAALSLSSCSGLNDTCTTNCNNGDANVTLTIFDTPPTGASVLAFSLPIVGISLTPQSGSPVAIYSPSSVQPTELTRLQADSSLIVSGVTVSAGNYTSLNITIAATSGIFINTTGSSITYKLNGTNTTCVNFAVCNLPAGAATTVNVPITLSLNSNQNQWIGIDVNLNNAITSTNGITVDFTQANVFTATTAARAGLPSGAVDTIEDFTGKVTALSNSGITVQNAITGQSLSAVVTSNTGLSVVASQYNTGCGSSNPATCIQVGSIVSLSANLASDGTLTATQIDGIDTTATDEIEGVIYPVEAAGKVGLILLDKTVASSNQTLAGSTFGTPYLLDASSTTATYSVDTGPLTNSGISTVGFSGSGNLLAGQVVRVQVSNVAVSNNLNTATAVNVLLRWSRVSATVNSTGGSTFTLTSIPVYLSGGTNGLNPSVPVTPQVITYQGYTAFDGINDVTGLTVSSPVAIRALFFDVPPSGSAQYSFQAAKVRVP